MASLVKMLEDAINGDPDLSARKESAVTAASYVLQGLQANQIREIFKNEPPSFQDAVLVLAGARSQYLHSSSSRLSSAHSLHMAQAIGQALAILTEAARNELPPTMESRA